MDFKVAQSKQPQARLYQLVYGARLLKYVIAMMMCFFLLHPVMPAFASELEVSDSDDSAASSETSDTSAEPEPEPETMDSSANEADNTDEPTENTEPETITETTVTNDDTVEEVEPETILEADESSQPTADSEVVKTEEVDTLADTETAASSTINNGEEESSTAGDEVQEVDSETATSSTETQTQPAIGSGGSGTSSDEVSTTTPDSNPATTTTTTASNDAGSASSPGDVATTTSSASNDETSGTDEPTTNESEGENDEVTNQSSSNDSSDSSDGSSDNAATDGEVAGVATTTATSTVPEPVYMEITGDVTHTNDSYNFTRQSCTAMGDGSYYCFDEGDALLAAVEPGVYVERDSDGDRELFYRDEKGSVTQLTFNTVDDVAPAYDPISDTVVWQRLAQGRYHIYTTEDGEEKRVSTAGANNMEPHRYGDYVVWQSWRDDGWDVVLYDGEVEQVISDSAAQDIAPHIQGTYVIWNTTSGNETVVTVYDIETGLRTTITDTEGGRVENPRFVLIYDTKYANGDVVTMGFDAETGEVVPLAAQPATPPPDIPDSDQTGETRALIQNKSTSREDVEGDMTPKDNVDEEPEEDESDLTIHATSTPDVVAIETVEEGVVDMSAPTTSNDTLPLTDYDLIVEPYETPSSTTATSTQ